MEWTGRGREVEKWRFERNKWVRNPSGKFGPAIAAFTAASTASCLPVEDELLLSLMLPLGPDL